MKTTTRGAARRSPILSILTLLALLPATSAAWTLPTQEADPVVACERGPLDVPLCPDLVVDGLDLGEIHLTDSAFAPGHCAVVESLVEPGERRLMRFGVTTANVGAADLVLGAPWNRPDLFTWSDCHAHYHLESYAEYRLWTPAGYAAWVAARAAASGKPASEVMTENPDVAADHVAGLKVGFCIMDVKPVLPRAIAPKFATCSHQGLTAGWADRYAWMLDGQWIDVTGLPAGHYVLEVEVNPERVIEEAAYDNNAASTMVYVYS